MYEVQAELTHVSECVLPRQEVEQHGETRPQHLGRLKHKTLHCLEFMHDITTTHGKLI